MLRRIQIRGFKSIQDVDVELAPVVVLLGPNAVGKSNLLEAIQLVSRVVTERTLADAFQQPLRGYPLEAFSLPREGMPGLLAQDAAVLSLTADIGPSGTSAAQGDSLRYRVEISIDPRAGALQIADEYLARLKRDGTPKHRPRIEREGKKLMVRQLEKAGRPLEEQLGLNHTLASNLQFSGEKRYPDFDQLRQELSAWRMYYLDPRTAMRTAQTPREVTDIGSSGEWIAAFLYRLKESKKHQQAFKAVARAVRSAIPSVQSLDVDLDPKRGTLDITIMQEGTPLSSRIISEGTLRVLALCAIAANPWPGRLVAFEEPENGVHPRRIEVVADLLANLGRTGRTQVIVSTHSPTLVAAMARLQEQSPEDIRLLRCSQHNMTTRVSPLGDSGPMFADIDVRAALSSSEDNGHLVAEAMRRGWLDG